jgi:hypothetical protein
MVSLCLDTEDATLPQNGSIMNYSEIFQLATSDISTHPPSCAVKHCRKPFIVTRRLIQDCAPACFFLSPPRQRPRPSLGSMNSLPKRPRATSPPKPDAKRHEPSSSSAPPPSLKDFPFFLPLLNPSSAAPLKASSTAFQQPSLLTTYSMHAPLTPSSSSSPQPRHRSFDNSSLSLYRPCPINANLREGFPNNVTYRSHDLNEGIDGLLDSLGEEERKRGGRAWEKGKEPVVCFRGVLTKIVTTPYEKRDGFKCVRMLRVRRNGRKRARSHVKLTRFRCGAALHLQSKRHGG